MITDANLIAAWEHSYGFTLTDEERDLLTTGSALQTPIERQQAYVLRMAMESLECPACLTTTCQRAALGHPFEWNTPTPDDAYHCPNCKRQLVWHLGFYAGQIWFTLAEPLPPLPSP